jgi:hypothetical protein
MAEWVAWWTWDPLVLAGLAVGVALYTRGALRLWREAGAGHGLAPWRAAAYGGGIVVIAFALVSPIDRASDVLFSAHMVQHELLMLVAAPLVVLGRPIVPVVWAARPAARADPARDAAPAGLARADLAGDRAGAARDDPPGVACPGAVRRRACRRADPRGAAPDRPTRAWSDATALPRRGKRDDARAPVDGSERHATPIVSDRPCEALAARGSTPPHRAGQQISRERFRRR